VDLNAYQEINHKVVVELEEKIYAYMKIGFLQINYVFFLNRILPILL
jgi:hypothetical protein